MVVFGQSGELLYDPPLRWTAEHWTTSARAFVKPVTQLVDRKQTTDRRCLHYAVWGSIKGSIQSSIEGSIESSIKASIQKNPNFNLSERRKQQSPTIIHRFWFNYFSFQFMLSIRWIRFEIISGPMTKKNLRCYLKKLITVIFDWHSLNFFLVWAHIVGPANSKRLSAPDFLQANCSQSALRNAQIAGPSFGTGL